MTETTPETLAAEENSHFLAILTDFGELLRGDDELPPAESKTA